MNQPYDTSGDGVADVWASDSNSDGVADTFGIDANQDGVYDGVAVDQNFDGYVETAGVDKNQDGIYEQVVVNNQVAVDTDGDGAADTWTSQATPYESDGIVGGAPAYDGVDSLVLDLASETGTPTYGTPDSDSDGYNDTVDQRPFDNDSY